MGHTQAEDRMQRSSGGAIFRDQAPGHRAGNESGGREEPEQPESASGWGSLPHRVLSWGPSSWRLPPATVSLKGSSISLADAVMLAFLFIQNSRLFNFSYCSNWNIKKNFISMPPQKNHTSQLFLFFYCHSHIPIKLKHSCFMPSEHPDCGKDCLASLARSLAQRSQFPSLFYFQ